MNQIKWHRLSYIAFGFFMTSIVGFLLYWTFILTPMAPLDDGLRYLIILCCVCVVGVDIFCLYQIFRKGENVKSDKKEQIYGKIRYHERIIDLYKKDLDKIE